MQFFQKKLQPVWHQIEGALAKSSSISRFLQYLGVLPLADRPSVVQLNENILRISVFADFYLRARARQQFLDDCEHKGIQLTVVGRNVEKYQQAGSGHHFEQALSFEQLKSRIRHARFIAHNSPGFERGFHERVITPLSMGTLVLSDVRFLKQHFGTAVIAPEDASSVTAKQYNEASRQAQQSIKEKHTFKAQWQPLLNQL